MRYSFSLTLLFLLLVLPVLNCTATPAPELELKTEINKPQIEGADSSLNAPGPASDLSVEPQVSTPAHLSVASSFVGTTELSGANDGPEIERFLGSVGLAKGNPYCAAFVSYVLDESPGVKQPEIRSGLASKFITSTSIDAKEVLRGTVTVPDGTIVVWRKGNTIFGHAGIVETQAEKNLYETIEANTSSGVYGNQRDGDGVWRRHRSIQPGNYFRITTFTKVIYV